MREYVIITDTNSDLPKEYVTQRHILQIPQYTTLDGVTYEGAEGIEPSEFYRKMREGSMPQSQAINPAVVEETFRSVLAEGKDILYISFASTLSSSYNVAAMTAKELEEEFPEAKICVVDSMNVSLSEGLLVHKAWKKKEAGCSLEENVKWLEENKLHVCVKFTVDDLHHLQRGGRVSKTTAVVGSILNIKPMMILDDSGQLKAVGTVRTRKKALMALVDYMGEKIPGWEAENDMVAIVHGDCLKDAQFVAEQVKERFHIPEVMINDINPSIGVHAGPGALGLLFFGTGRE
ncbi:MAG: DegV family protein [Lachnospiraceae bacterium]|nr:DegV family protein [Candidatus Fimimorpha excrementavium]